MSTTNNSQTPGALSDRVQSLRLPNRGGNGGASKLPWLLCVLLLLSTLAFGYQAFTKPKEGDSGAAKSSPGLNEKTADSGDIVLQAKGYIIPAHTIQVSPQVSGKIEKLNIEEGKRVKKGDTLAVIEKVEYDAKYKRALAKYESAKQTAVLATKSYPEEVERAKAELNEAKADHARLKDQLDRAERLDPVAQSREDIIRMRNETAMGDARIKRRSRDLEISNLSHMRVKALEFEGEAARAEMEEAKWRLDNCIITAPVSGTILTKKAEESNVVNSLSQNLSASLCEMADLSDLEVDLQIQERDVSIIVVGQNCTVMPEAFQKDERFLKKHPKGYEGYVSRLMPIADRAKGSIPVRVKVTVPREEEGVYLKPDMGVIVSFKKVDGDKPKAEGPSTK